MIAWFDRGMNGIVKLLPFDIFELWKQPLVMRGKTASNRPNVIRRFSVILHWWETSCTRLPFMYEHYTFISNLFKRYILNSCLNLIIQFVYLWPFIYITYRRCMHQSYLYQLESWSWDINFDKLGTEGTIYPPWLVH